MCQYTNNHLDEVLFLVPVPLKDEDPEWVLVALHGLEMIVATSALGRGKFLATGAAHASNQKGLLNAHLVRQCSGFVGLDVGGKGREIRLETLNVLGGRKGQRHQKRKYGGGVRSVHRRYDQIKAHKKKYESRKEFARVLLDEAPAHPGGRGGGVRVRTSGKGGE